MLNTIIFDLNELMIDSEIISYKFYKEFLKTYNIKFFKKAYIKEYPGKATKQTVKLFNEKYRLNYDIV